MKTFSGTPCFSRIASDFDLSTWVWRLAGSAVLSLLVSFQAMADGTEILGSPSISIASGTGIVAAGTGLIEQPGEINITVPGAVRQVILYWEGFNDRWPPNTYDLDDTISVNGVDVTGTRIGGPATFWGSVRSSVFRADITALSNDMGWLREGVNVPLSIAGMDFSEANNGAGVMVIYDDGTTSSEIQIRDGLDLAYFGFEEPQKSTILQTFTFPAASIDRKAILDLFFSSVVGVASGAGRLRPESIEVTVAGVTTTFSNNLFSQDGEEWDTVNFSGNEAIDIPAGVTELSIQAFSRDDFLKPECEQFYPDGLPVYIDPTGDLNDPDNLLCPRPASFTWTAVGLAIPLEPPLAALGDRVWLDLDGDGIQDCLDNNGGTGNGILGDLDDGPDTVNDPFNDECLRAGMEGVEVRLYKEEACGGRDPDGSNAFSTTNTDVNGLYLFDNLDPGGYCVVFVKPSGFECTGTNVGNNDAVDSDGDINADGVICRTDEIVLSPGETNRSVDLGLVNAIVPASLGDRVWEDLDADGIQDCMDDPNNSDGIIGNTGDTGPECGAGIAGIPVTLYFGDCATPQGSMTNTDANGFYLFTELDPGDYCVEFGKLDDPDFCFADEPFAFNLGEPQFTSQNANNNNSDTLDSDANLDGISDFISLAAGQTNRTVDAGIICPAKIGDRVWEDLDADGIQDCTDDPNNSDGIIGNTGDTGPECGAGIDGIKVTLFDCGIDGQPGGDDDTVIGDRTTDLEGFYMFGAEPNYALPPGTYYVQFDQNTLPKDKNYILTDPKKGGDDTLDSDCMPDGITQCVTVGPRGINLNRDCGVRPPVPECDLLLDKQCRVAPKPLVTFEKCDGKLKQFTVIWNHPDPITITGSQNIASAPQGVVNFGDPVTFSGFSNNNVIVNFSSADPGLNGQSVFHVSCSDSEFNSPDDCGKDAGDGKKSKGGFDNTWTLGGFIDKAGRVVDCNAGTGNGTFANNCEIVASPLPNCETTGKPTSLTLKYTGGGCGASDNDQDKDKCTENGIVSGDVSVRAAKDKKFEKDFYTVTPDFVGPGGTFELTFNGGSKFKSKAYVELTNGSVTELDNIHTSCSNPLVVGDVFGSLTVVAINGQSGGTDVTYKYTVINSGAPLSDIKVTDVPLGDIGTIAFLDTGSLATLETTVPISGSITNVGTASAFLNNEVCSASDSVTVTVTPPPTPPAECKELKPIDALILEYDASQTGGKSIDKVSWYSKDVDNSNFINSTGPVNNGDVVTFGGFAAADADNNVDFLIEFSDGSTATSRFHRSCSDREMNDVTDCGTLQGNGKDGDGGLLNTWILRDLAGNGKVLGCP